MRHKRKKYVPKILWLICLALFNLPVNITHAQTAERTSSIAWSPDGEFIAVGTYGQINIFDGQTLEYRYRLRANRADIISLAWSPDSTHLISNDSSDNSLIWDAATGAIKGSYGSGVANMAPIISRSDWNFDGSLIADNYDFGSQFTIRDGQKGKTLASTFPTFSDAGIRPMDFAWSEQANQIAISSFDNRIVLVEADTWRIVDEIPTEGRLVVDKWDDQYLYTTPYYDSNPDSPLFRYILQVWDTATKQAVSTFDVSSIDSFNGRLWSPDGSKVAVWRSGRILQIWDVMTGEVIQSQQFPAWRQTFTWSPDSARLALAYSPRDVQIVELPLTGERLPPPPTGWLTYFSDYNQDGSQALAQAKLDEAPYEPGDYIGYYGLPAADLVYREQPAYYDWSPDGERFIYARKTEEHYQIVEDVIDWNRDIQLTTTDGWNLFPVYAPADFAEEAEIAYLHSSDEELFELYLMSADRQTTRPLVESGSIYVERPAWMDKSHLAFSMQTGDDYDIYRLDIDDGKPERLFEHPGNDHYPEWSPDGKQLAFVSDIDAHEAIYIYDVESGEIRLLTEGTEPEWSPDGARIAFTLGKHIYVIDPDGENLSLFIADASTPRWVR